MLTTYSEQIAPFLDQIAPLLKSDFLRNQAKEAVLLGITMFRPTQPPASGHAQ